MSEEPLYIRPETERNDAALGFDSDYLDETLPSARVPNLGHALLFASFSGLLLFLSQLMAISLAHTSHDPHARAQILMQPKWELASMAATYILTLGSCFLVFPLFWQRSLLAGLNWQGPKAMRLTLRLVSLGLSVGWCVQALSSLVPMPKSIPMDDFFRTPADVWLVTLFGTLLAPLFEEVAFRGFLLPAFSIAFDWLGPMLRYVAAFSFARLRGRELPMQVAVFREAPGAGLAPDTGNIYFRSRTSKILASVLTSVLFARMHADQLGHAWAAVGILFGVSLVLSVIRVQTRSLACSTVVHMSYNLSVFVTLFLATGGIGIWRRLGDRLLSVGLTYPDGTPLCIYADGVMYIRSTTFYCPNCNLRLGSFIVSSQVLLGEPFKICRRCGHRYRSLRNEWSSLSPSRKVEYFLSLWTLASLIFFTLCGVAFEQSELGLIAGISLGIALNVPCWILKAWQVRSSLKRTSQA